MRTASYAWRDTVCDVMSLGETSAPRGQETKEIVNYTNWFDMVSPVVTVPERGVGYKFMAAEAAWIMSGDARLSTIRPFAEKMKQFSDDGVFLFGAYGPRVVSQVSHVVQSLIKDQDSRQAVIGLWRESPRATKDVPCTLTAQWLIRDGELHCIDNMRSSDTVLGWPYDVFTFSCISCGIAVMLREHGGVNVKLGRFHLNAGSQHVYERDFAMAREVAFAVTGPQYVVPPSPVLDPGRFTSWDHMVDTLWRAAESGALATAAFV